MTEYDTIADTLNEVIERAERVVGRLGYHIHIEMPIMGRTLAYSKTGSGWRLVWIKDGKEILVSNSSRELRLEAARAFPALYQKITETDRVLVENARKVVEDFDQFVGSLEEQVET